MLLKTQDTIAAIATAIVPEQGSIGVVRLSGTQSIPIAQILFDPPGNQPWKSHRILYGYIRDPFTHQIIDEALLLIMKAPRSYTKEDIVEFQTHGGIIIIQQVLQLCLQQGARLAQPGEFTLRAFLNGRIDLSQAESIKDLVGAKSPQAALYAISALQGKLKTPIQQLKTQAINILAEIEARIDFEEDLPALDQKRIETELNEIKNICDNILATAKQGELIRTGLKVAIVGRPNVGKSSLLNAWSKTDRAIVTDLPGTTRDIVESQLIVKGIPIQVLDTAGIRETQDKVEQIGVERTQNAAKEADLILLTIDATSGWTLDDQVIYEQVQHKLIILVINKIDLVKDNFAVNHLPDFPYIVKTSATHQTGISDLENQILAIIQAGNLNPSNLDFLINQRQEAALIKARNSLQHVQETIDQSLPLDFWTIDLRAAIQALAEITGEDITESVLDKVFSSFCIGK